MDLESSFPLFSAEPKSITRDELLAFSKGSLQKYLSSSSSDDAFVENVFNLWRALLATLRGALVERHLTAICNCICVFLNAASRSPNASVRELVLRKESWIAAFNVMLTNFDGGKLKPLRQVLDTLIKILDGLSADVSQSITEEVLANMVTVSFLGRPRGLLKASIIIIESFLRSGFPFSSLVTIIGQCYRTNHDLWISSLKSRGIWSSALFDENSDSTSEYLFSLALIVANSDSPASAGTFLMSFIARLEGHGLPSAIWVDHILVIWREIPTAVEAFKNHFLIPMLNRQPNSFNDLAERMKFIDGDDNKLETILTVLLASCEAGRASEDEILDFLSSSLQSTLCYTRSSPEPTRRDLGAFNRLLSHSSGRVRMRTFELLIAPVESSRPLSPEYLYVLTEGFPYLYGDADPKYRGEAESITRALFSRLRKSCVQQAKLELGRDVTYCYEAFFHRLIGFWELELGPNCSFPRRIAALRGLKLLISFDLDPGLPPLGKTAKTDSSVMWPFRVVLLRPNLICALLNLLLDSFEQIRATAASTLIFALKQSYHLLVDYLDGNVNVEDRDYRSGFFRRIQMLLYDADWLTQQTCRADLVDGTGYLWLLETLAASRARRGSAMVHIVRGCDIYVSSCKRLSRTKCSSDARLLGLRYLIDEAGLFMVAGVPLVTPFDLPVEELLRTLRNTWEEVRDCLCVDSPEFSKDDEDGSNVGPKDTLARSWRALRDSSLVMQSILMQLPKTNWDLSVLESVVEPVYQLCHHQLTLLRHRGAFATVAQTFALCCEQLAKCRGGKLEESRRTLLQLIKDQSSKSTRRSAGLPSILAGLLVPVTPAEFDIMVEALINIANVEPLQPVGDLQDIRLPQVHALNCLRELMTNARFREQSSPHLSSMLVLAASSLKCPVWAIRNCGLMLFRACASRFEPMDFGGTFEELTLSEQSQAAVGVSLKLIAPSEDSESADLIFAGLDLISRLAPGPVEEAVARAAVLHHVESRVWALREHAARVYSSRISSTQAIEDSIRLLRSLDLVSQNRCHGILLCVQGVLEKLSRTGLVPDQDQVTNLLQTLDQLTGVLYHAVAPVKSVFIEVISQCVTIWPDDHFSAILARSLGSGNNIDKCDSSTGCSKNSTRAHAGTPLLTACMVFHSLSMALSDSTCVIETLAPGFQRVAIEDPDCATIVLRRLAVRITSRSASRIAGFLTAIELDNVSSSVREALLQALSESLHQSLEAKGSIRLPGELPGHVERLARSAEREEFNAAMLTAGAILAHLGQKQSVESIPLFHTWTKMLQASVQNLTDAAARFDAARSLLFFRGCLVDGTKKLSGPAAMLLFSICYDFANDDDEEVRAIASEAMSLPLRSEHFGGSGRFCPLATRRRLVDHMIESFPTSPEFHLHCLARIVQPGLRFGTGELFLDQHSSALEQLYGALDVSYDLFEEEKQNLYIDELGEIDVWYSAMCRAPVALNEPNIIGHFGPWAIDGLDEIVKFVASFKEASPYGPGWRPETLIVLLRILRVTDLVLRWTKATQDSSFSRVVDRIGELQASVKPFYLHPRIEEVLKNLHADWEKAAAE